MIVLGDIVLCVSDIGYVFICTSVIAFYDYNVVNVLICSSVIVFYE